MRPQKASRPAAAVSANGPRDTVRLPGANGFDANKNTGIPQPGSPAVPAAAADLPEIHVGAYQVMPDMTPEEFAALKADIATRGVISPIDIDETGAILDGHNRYRAWTELQRNEPPPVIVRAGLSEEEKRSFAFRQNIKRRHLSRVQIQGLIERELKDRPDRSDRKIGADLGIDHKTIGRLRRGLNATGEVPQLDATTGADGRVRRRPAASTSRRTRPDREFAEALARVFGGRVGADGLPADLKAAMFDAGMTAETTVVVQGSPFAEPYLSEEQVKAWTLFGQLLETKCGWSNEGGAIGGHLDWLIRHDFKTPDEWLGEEGTRYRKLWGMREPSDEFKGWWRALKSGGTTP